MKKVIKVKRKCPFCKGKGCEICGNKGYYLDTAEAPFKEIYKAQGEY